MMLKISYSTVFQVLPYGSVPLKTYLPDGDIDLTAFAGANVEEAVANDIVSELQRQERDSDAEFLVKEIRLIHAEVIILTSGGVKLLSFIRTCIYFAPSLFPCYCISLFFFYWDGDA